MDPGIYFMYMNDHQKQGMKSSENDFGLSFAEYSCSAIRKPVVMKQFLLLFIPLFCICTCTTAQRSVSKKASKYPAVQQGIASFYADKFQGRLMANGKKYDQHKLTAAGNRFALGTWVKVSNLSNKKSVVVQITDRMHPKNKRLIDLSKAAAKKLGFIKKGLTKVKVEVIKKP